MHRAAFWVVLMLCVVTPFPIGAADGDGNIKILTYPIGLVTGEQEFDVDLGPGGEPAELYLDGTQVCSVTADRPHCTVNLGKAPHVHLLELIRRGPDGRVQASASRWVNRPGQEAELALQLAPRSPQGICSGTALWLHPLKKDPVFLEVTENGRPLRIREDGRSFAFPCPDPNEPHLLAASAIFSDGKRAETVTLSGGFGGSAETDLTAVALAPVDQGVDTCERASLELGDEITTAKGAGYEVVFVLDPTAGHHTLMASGWYKGMMPTITTGTKQFDTLVQQGSKGSDARPKNSWKRAESSLISAEKMWFVLPDEHLQRANGFAQGTMNWLLLLFNFGATKLDHTPHLADAVAASGLVAAAGPRRRAVVLILGNKADRDDSTFTAEQAMNYLAEVGVPLYVLRNGKLRDDGWPEGAPIKSMEEVAANFERIRNDLDQQCVTWFPGNVHPNLIAASLPQDLEIAGRQGQAAEVGEVWQRAELADGEAGAAGAAAAAATSGEPVARARIEVTAVTVLVTARDASGEPVSDLSADELTVLEDGDPVAVLGLNPVPTVGVGKGHREATAATEGIAEEARAAQIPVSIYVDRRLSGSKEITGAIDALAARSQWMVSLGPVDVVVADNDVSTLSEGVTNPEELRSTLLALADRPGGQHAIEQVRTRFLRDIRKLPDRTTHQDLGVGPDSDREGQSAQPPREAPENRTLERSVVLNAARSAIFEEDALLQNSMMRVSDWALTWPSSRPRVLFVVGAGFDEDPVDFYLPFVERMETQSARSAREEFRRFSQAQRIERTGIDLAADGWLVVPVAVRSTGSQTGAAEISGGDRFQMFMSAQPDAIRTSYAQFLLLDPLGSQKHLAAPSGGEVAMGGDGLDRLIESTAGWYRLSYQIDRAPDGADHHLEITSTRPGVALRSTSFIASETAEGEATARLRRLLMGAVDRGELGVEIGLSNVRREADKQMTADAAIEVTLDAISSLLAEGEMRNLRVSVAVQAGQAAPFVLHRVETVEGVVDSWSYTVPLQWPGGPARLAVVVEDLGSGVWGGAVATLQ